MDRPNLIFDLSETLIGGLFWMAGPLARRVGQPEDTVVKELGGDPLTALIEARWSEREYWEAILEATRWGVTTEELAAMARDAFRQAVPGMPQLLRQLRTYRLILLSDHATEWMEDIDRHHSFLEAFERRFVSCEMRRTKRSTETFVYVAGELGSEPGDCVFVDDLQWNIDRATAVGFRAIRFRSADQVREELQQLGVHPEAM